MRFNLLNYASGLGLVAGALLWPSISHAQGFCYMVNARGEVINLDGLCQSNNVSDPAQPQGQAAGPEGALIEPQQLSLPEVRSFTLTGPPSVPGTGTDAVQTLPDGTQTAPGATQTTPGTTQTAPGQAVPDATQTTPGTTLTVPGATQTTPGATQPVPGTTQTAPGATQPGPGPVQPVPGATQTFPGSTRTVPAVPIRGIEPPQIPTPGTQTPQPQGTTVN
ncbi:hypothetical protein [Leptolyngbya sp. KIOST-1]|uniref:hypothetical protein n=1 Tax=Leptolyngbya sp. KIOST-1 TaxID=1229172 RepID=UPI0012E08626|nr:hypothetical protein [Leptolyngbya sp. KIOST-1]